MSDFEDRVGRALGAGAEGAPAAHGLADGARRRLRVRRPRLAVGGAAAAVLAVVVPVAVIGGPGGSSPRPGREGGPATDGVEALDTRVTCGGDASWPVSAMADGIPNDVDDAEVRTAFGRLNAAAGFDEPRSILEQGADAPYIVLAVGGGEVTVGVGPWTVEGPDGAGTVTLERTAEGLRPTSWGDCHQLAVVLPEGRSRVAVTAPRGGVDPSATSPQVLVNEVQCASGRDPAPYLGRPLVDEQEDRVLVTMSSEEVVGDATCQGNPSVPVTLELDEPLGDRQLLDAGTWPPTPIRVAAADAALDGWHAVEVEGVRFELPPHWDELDCPAYTHHFGPGTGRCGEGDYVTFYPEATFDPAMGPGEILEGEEDGTTLWIGYAIVGDWAVVVRTQERRLTQEILATVGD